MSEVYNPETKRYEKLESLELEARSLVRRRDAAANAADRRVIEQQLTFVEEQIELLRKRFRR
ncbi:MAG: hypothetical protein GC164_00025 [Phycisphaera sp.]|nr:hypothetical protein [Phycisphaera sp.]